MRHRILKTLAVVLAAVMTLSACTVTYKLNGASIDYNKIKTITLDSFTNRAAYQWAPMAPMFNYFFAF